MINFNDSFNSSFKFLLWLFTGFLICIVGISNVFGLTYTDIGDKADITVVLVSTDYASSPFNVPKNSSYNFEQVLEVDYIVSNYNFEANKNYQLESHLTNQTFTNANYYTVQGANGEQCLISYDNSIFTGNYPRWAFQCPHATNTITLSISNSAHEYLWNSGIYTWTTALLKYSDTSLSSGTGDSDSIINNQNQNTQSIINNQNQNTQDIINNQNQNTQNIIDSNKVCNMIDNSNVITRSYMLNSNGEEISISYYGITGYINIQKSTIQTFNVVSDSAYSCFYDTNKSLISCVKNQDMVENGYLTIPINANYFRASIQTTYQNKPRFNICTDGNQAFNDTITDDSPVDISSLGDTAGWLPAGPIDSIINLPLNLFNNLLTALNGTCSPLNVPLPYVNRNMSIPCISTIFGQINGLTNFWNWVGAIASVVILYRYLLALYKYYDDLTTMKANFISDFGGAP